MKIVAQFFRFCLSSYIMFVVHGDLITSNAPSPKYRVALAIQPPYLESVELPDGEMGYQGLTWDLWNNVIEQGFGSHVNFTYEEVSQYPMYPDDRGNLLGQIGELVKGTVDIALGPFMHSPQAEQFVDFSMPYTPPVGITVLYQSQKKDILSNRNIGEFLRKAVCAKIWLLICAACIVMCLFWLSMVKAGLGCSRKSTALSPVKLFPTLMLGTWIVCFMILTFVYIDHKTYISAPAIPEYPIKSFDDLHKQYDIKFSTTQNSGAYEYFKIMAQLEEKAQESYMNSFFGNSGRGGANTVTSAQKSLGREYIRATNSKYQRIWRMMQAVGVFANSEAAVQDVIHKKLAFVGDTNEIRYAQMNHCNLETIPDVIGEWPMVLAVQQGSPLVNVINTAILKMLNQRELSELQEKWWDNNKMNRKNCDPQAIADNASISSALWALVLILISVCFAALASLFIVLGMWAVQMVCARKSAKGKVNINEGRMEKALPPIPVENDYVDLNDKSSERENIEP